MVTLDDLAHLPEPQSTRGNKGYYTPVEIAKIRKLINDGSVIFPQFRLVYVAGKKKIGNRYRLFYSPSVSETRNGSLEIYDGGGVLLKDIDYYQPLKNIPVKGKYSLYDLSDLVCSFPDQSVGVSGAID